MEVQFVHQYLADCKQGLLAAKFSSVCRRRLQPRRQKRVEPVEKGWVGCFQGEQGEEVKKLAVWQRSGGKRQNGSQLRLSRAPRV